RNDSIWFIDINAHCSVLGRLCLGVEVFPLHRGTFLSAKTSLEYISCSVDIILTKSFLNLVEYLHDSSTLCGVSYRHECSVTFISMNGCTTSVSGFYLSFLDVVGIVILEVTTTKSVYLIPIQSLCLST